MKKLIINLAPTGMIPTKQMSQYVPITPEEITADILHCSQLGISMVHIHARDSLLERIINIARTVERPIATPKDVRKMLNLSYSDI